MSAKLARRRRAVMAKNQVEYQTLMDKVRDHIDRTMPSSPEELLQITMEKMGAYSYDVIASAPNSTNLEVLIQGPEQNIIDRDRLNKLLLERLKEGKNRYELVPLPEDAKSRNLLLARLGENQDDPGWNNAIVFIGRKRPPVKDASPGFLTRDFPVMEKVVYLYEVISAPSFQYLRHANQLRDELAYYMGPRTRLTIGEGELVISGIATQRSPEHLATQAVAQKCIARLFGWGIVEQTYLEREVAVPRKRVTVDEFRIVIQGFPVYGRRISVRRLPQGTTAEVILPQGWWWAILPRRPRISKKKAVEIALQAEQSEQSDVPDLEAHVVERVLWPQGPPGRVVHEVQVTSKRGISPTYFIDAYNGDVISRDDNIRE